MVVGLLLEFIILTFSSLYLVDQREQKQKQKQKVPRIKLNNRVNSRKVILGLEYI